MSAGNQTGARRVGRPTVLGLPLGAEELFVIAGPCVVEGRAMIFDLAGRLREITDRLGIRLLFKASYRKDNRSAVDSYTGPGDDEALAILAAAKAELGLAVLTDVHCRAEVREAASVADCLQIPAFLCRQTRLLQAAALAAPAVNVKNGQFMAPDDMQRVVDKIRAARPEAEVWMTERGASFGYHNLVVDMRSFPVLRTVRAASEVAAPPTVVYDVTHSLQHPGVGGDRRYARPLARAAIAAGADGLFLETHPDPARALSDATTQLPLAGVADFLEEMLEWKRLQARYIDRDDPVGIE
ncbi:MAG: 3-deoxy-8-phosphooctulonate synthase [Candidatus Eisenbacteria bacterium]|nr:3-deoxy-8-phosphooctulonate synthase [Candidatus Eisenbacteria bacterium]